MSTTEDDSRLDEILAHGHLGGPRYDEILRRVLSEVKVDKPTKKSRWLFASGTALVAALGTWLIFGSFKSETYRVKGPDAMAMVALEIACASSNRHLCHPDDTLMFSVNTAVASGYLGAFAQRLDGPAQDRIWYFPSATGAAPYIAPGRGTTVVGDGIHIGPEHSPGHYRITVWLSSRLLSRVQIAHGDTQELRSRATFDVQITDKQ